MQPATLKQVKANEICKKYLREIASVTDGKVSPSACIITFYELPYVQAYAYTTDESLAEEEKEYINNSKDVKPVSEYLRRVQKYETIQGKMSDYFVTKNKLTEKEELFLKAAGYNTNIGIYFTFAFPSVVEPEGIFFLFVHDPDEAKEVEAKISEIRELFMLNREN